MSTIALCSALPLLLSVAAQSRPETPPTPERIWYGGPVLTMEDAAPRAEAVAVGGGRILAVGDRDAVLALAGPDTETIDLEGHALLPGFVDAHGHVGGVGLQAMAANLLAPPDGPVDSIPALQEALRAWRAENAEFVERLGIVIGFGYDDAQLAEQRHPDRDELDAVATDVPILIVHQSGHISVGNSATLALCGFGPESEDPPGGVIRRRPGTREPDGVLEETPHFQALIQVFSALDADGARAMAAAGMELVASYGYTTAQEGRASTAQVTLFRTLAAAGELPIDVVAYPDVLVDREAILRDVSREYVDHFRVGGAKLTIDGSPQGFTALRDRPYHAPPAHYRADYKGYSAVTPDQVFDAVDWAYAHDVQLLTHANGEGAIDLLLAALATADARHGRTDRRPVLIHGQFLRRDQVEPLDRLGVVPSLFPMHTFYWGDWHRERTVGPLRADDISPTGWVLERGMRFTTHHDAPVAFPDSMRVLDATVTRRSRSGDVLGPEHRVDVLTALRAMTLWPAYQHFEEDSKGSIRVGKLADLVVLSVDPTAIDPEDLDGIEVLATIHRGRTVYTAPDRPRYGRLGTDRARDGFGDFLRRAALTEEYLAASGGGSARARAVAAARAAADGPHARACTARFVGTLIDGALAR